MGLQLSQTKTRRHRFQLIRGEAAEERASFADDVRAGLTASPKHLSCRFFYDERGSQLFDAICELPEYYPTRCERRILADNADAIAASLPECQSIVELGSGSASKTRKLIKSFHHSRRKLRYMPIDISPAPLISSSELLLADFPRLSIVAVAAEYRPAFTILDAHADSPKLILWLGSSIGNFDPDSAASFLKELVERTGPNDHFLIGMDLQKDTRTLERAYNDQQGVTAEFNKNLLRRINRELGGDFDLDRFEHVAHYNREWGRIELHLRSNRRQRAAIDRLQLEIEFEESETIHTENSYKFTRQDIERLSGEAGLTLDRQWFDPHRQFSLNLFSKTG